LGILDVDSVADMVKGRLTVIKLVIVQPNESCMVSDEVRLNVNSRHPTRETFSARSIASILDDQCMLCINRRNVGVRNANKMVVVDEDTIGIISSL